jgi:ABC-type polar amino acid transport system ATPase subunit
VKTPAATVYADPSDQLGVSWSRDGKVPGIEYKIYKQELPSRLHPGATLTIPLAQDIGQATSRHASEAHKRQNSSGVRELNSMLELFELDGLADRYPNEASLGQRQRAALVRALVLKPKYLLLDEITSALDVEHVSKILEHLKLLRTQGVGILLVTHLVGFARSAADQIVFMDNGHILESGGPSVLVSPKNVRFRTFLSLVETAV